MRVITREREHHEVHQVSYGKVYSWRPERVFFECDCGRALVSERFVAVCACGADYTSVLREPEEQRTEHPWHEEYEVWRGERETNNLRHEYFDYVGTGDD